MRTKLVGDGCQHCNPQITIDSLNDEIQTLRAKVASADVLVEALSTIRHNAYMDGSNNKTVSDIFKVADKAIMTYDKLSEGKHDTNK